MTKWTKSIQRNLRSLIKHKFSLMPWLKLLFLLDFHQPFRFFGLFYSFPILMLFPDCKLFNFVLLWWNNYNPMLLWGEGILQQFSGFWNCHISIVYQIIPNSFQYITSPHLQTLESSTFNFREIRVTKFSHDSSHVALILQRTHSKYVRLAPKLE